jgi:hypothetical protein
MSTPIDLVLVVEDALSLALVQRLVAHSGRGFRVYRTLIERGVENIRKSLPKYLGASHTLPHVIVVDLDRGVCAAALREQWGLTHLPPRVLFRVAVRESESWVMADRHGFAQFAEIALSKVPQDPDDLPDPKQTLVNLARRSRNKRLAQELTPAQGSAVSIGPLYNERLGQFVQQDWNVDEAAAVSPSLARARDRLQTFVWKESL